MQMCKLCSRMACCAKLPALPAHRSPVLLAGERCHGPLLATRCRPPPPAARRPAPRPFPRPTKMQGTRRPAHVFLAARARAPAPPPPSLRAHPRRRFPTTQAARRKTTLRRATSRAGDARRRALLCVGAFLLLVPAGARPGYRCGQHANQRAFAALDDEGAIHAWGNSDDGGSGAPSGTGFTAIFSTNCSAFAALDDQGAIHAWGHSDGGGSGAPSGTGFTAIFSTDSRSRRSTTRAPSTRGATATYGGSGAPSGTGFTAIFSTTRAFAALDDQGRIHAWGGDQGGGSGAPSGTGFTAIFSTCWGRSRRSTTRAPSTRGATATRRQRRAERHGLHRDLLDERQRRVRGARRPGRHPRVGPQRGARRQRRAERHGLHRDLLDDTTRSRRSTSRAPSTRGATATTAAAARRAARASPRSSRRNARSRRSTTRAPSTRGAATATAAAARRAARASPPSSRRVRVRGARRAGRASTRGATQLAYGGSGAPSGTGFTALFSTDYAFAALDEQGRIHAWGSSDWDDNGSGAPCGTGFTIASLSYSDTMGSDACPLPSLVRPTPCTEYTDEKTCNAQDECNWDEACLHLPTPCTEYTDEETCNEKCKCIWDGSACLQETDEDVPVGVLVAAIAGPTVGLALLVPTVVCVCKNKKAQPSGRAASDSVVVQGDPMGAKAPRRAARSYRARRRLVVGACHISHVTTLRARVDPNEWRKRAPRPRCRPRSTTRRFSPASGPRRTPRPRGLQRRRERERQGRRRDPAALRPPSGEPPPPPPPSLAAGFDLARAAATPLRRWCCGDAAGRRRCARH